MPVRRPRTAAQQAQYKKYAAAGGRASAAARRGTHLTHPRKSTAGQPRSPAQIAAFAAARRKGAIASANKRRGTHYHLKHPRKRKATTRKRTTGIRRTNTITGPPRLVARVGKSGKWGLKAEGSRSATPGYNPFAQ